MLNWCTCRLLVTGKAKAVIAEFAYCGSMYKDALNSLEPKFGQPQAVVGAYLDKLSNFPSLKMHNSEGVISCSATISALEGAFQSLHYHQDLSSASFLGKRPTNCHQIRKKLGSFKPWRRTRIVRHYLNSMIGWRSMGDKDKRPTNYIACKGKRPLWS